MEKEGYQVQAVETGAEAVGVMKGQRFDLALVDIKMPEMGGPETVKEIRTIGLAQNSGLQPKDGF